MLEICVVTPDFDGETRAVAERLSGDHSVTALVTRHRDGCSPADPAKRGSDGGRLRVIPCPGFGPQVIGYPSVVRAYRAWRWCRGRSFDAICFSELAGDGYFIALARRVGLDFHGTALVACCEGPTLWRLAGNGRLPSRDDLIDDHLQRASVAWADVALFRIREIVEWMADEAWRLPRHTRLFPPTASGAKKSAADVSAPAAIRELVFVGPLERRAGLVTFVHALRRLSDSLVAPLRVTFLGATPSDENAWQPREWLEVAMPPVLSWRVADPSEAAAPCDYLTASGRLGVAPGVTERLPAFVGECLARGLSFLACDAPETRELVSPEDWPDFLCPSDPRAVSAALSLALSRGVRGASARKHAGPTLDDERTNVIVEAVARRSRVGYIPGLAPPHAAPEVSVVLTHRNRPHLLEQALAALRRQTWRDFEVVLVDDGSDLPEAWTFLDALAPEFAARGWRIIRQSNQYLGAARNCGWRAARGRLILFHDDDNVSTPRQIERLVAAARYSGAAIVTSAFGLLHGTGPAPEETPGYQATVVPFLGGALARGFYDNCFGDAHGLVRRDALEALGGFTEDFGVGHEDWEFFGRAALAGYEVLALPEPLFWYRVSTESMLRTRPDIEPDMRRSARAYTDLLPPELRPILLAALKLGARLEAE